MRDLYAMELHEAFTSSDTDPDDEVVYSTKVTRVPGGWIYSDMMAGPEGIAMTSVFVPFNNEFMGVTN